MKLFIETWVRVESIIEADSADKAYDMVSNKIATKSGREEVIGKARCGGAIRCYDLNTGKKVEFSYTPSTGEQ